MLRSPKALLILAIGLAVFATAILGGALGAAFGLGFLGAPLAAIAIPAEPLYYGAFVTNTMLATWLAIALLLIVALMVRGRLAPVPGRLQGFVEIVIEFFLNLAESIAGREKARRFFPLAMTIFLFIVAANWMGILPGFGTIGWVESTDALAKHRHCDDYGKESAEYNACLSEINVQVFDEAGDGFAVLSPGSVGGDVSAYEWKKNQQEGKAAGLLIPFFRSANTDLNATLAIAIVAMVAIHYWGFSALGLGHLGKFINFKEGPIGVFVGFLEAIAEAARLISFTFRLFGNIFAGEVLLAAIIFLIPLIGIIPFLGLELFVGIIQAFIFSMLTLVFATVATVSHGDDHH